MKSPLRYPGGKTRACKILDQIIVNNNIKIDRTGILIIIYFQLKTETTPSMLSRLWMIMKLILSTRH